MPPLNTTSTVSYRTLGYAVADLLMRGQHDMVVERFGKRDPQGQNKTKTRKFRRYESLPRATAPLAEGVTPAGQQLNYTDITVTLEQFGDWVPISDVIADTHEDPVLKDATLNCGEAAAETKEVNRISVLKGGSNVFYASSATTRAGVNSPATLNDLRAIHRSFKKNKAREISEMIAPTAKVSTEPVSRGFFAFGSTDCLSDLKGLDGWVPYEQYSGMKALPSEYGKVEEFRFILTPLFEPWLEAGTDNSGQSTYVTGGANSTGSPDVYPLIFVARDSYAIVPLQGKKAVEMFVKNPGQATTDDPLAQRGFVSWKFWDGTVILNQLWLARLEVAVTQV